ncbi:hypothetical protein D3C76_1317530 [compost metagenome]
MPRLICGGRHLIRRISLSSTASCSSLRPAPPYSSGHSGQNQRLSRMRSNHRRASSQGNCGFWLPHTTSPSAMPVRMDGGQLASSQARVSCRNCSIVLMKVPLDPPRVRGEYGFCC